MILDYFFQNTKLDKDNYIILNKKTKENDHEVNSKLEMSINDQDYEKLYNETFKKDDEIIEFYLSDKILIVTLKPSF